jgi:hypothetical protein
VYFNKHAAAVNAVLALNQRTVQENQLRARLFLPAVMPGGSSTSSGGGGQGKAKQAAGAAAAEAAAATADSSAVPATTAVAV